MDFLIQLDTDIFTFLNGFHCGFFDSFMKLFSGRFIWVPMYAALLFIIMKTFTLRQSIIILLTVGVLITLADQTCATLIRPYVQRLRPSNLENPLSEITHIVDGHRGGSYGFPSCHAANSFALAVFMSLLLRRQRFVTAIVIWATLNSYSRIYLGVHYPGDLIAGALIGSAIAAICYFALCRIGFGGKRPDPLTDSASTIMFITPAGPLSPILRLSTLNYRYSDIFATVGLSTVLIITLLSLNSI